MSREQQPEFPKSGGSYERQPDQSLKLVEAPDVPVADEPHPTAPAAPATTAEQE
ncbi:MAG: hypothetical protein LCH95_13840 [Proteobacteria bacterium]|nr:hypothetical protein [Pseudomonadota bacterium]